MLAEAIIRCYVAHTDHSVALLYKGREIADMGYRRCPLPAGELWKLDGSVAEQAATWGPFFGPTVFDGIRLFGPDDVRLRDIRFSSEVNVAAGMIYGHDIQVSVGG